MKTHTIRNKNSPTPIITLSPEFFDLMLNAYPEASSIALAWFRTSYRNLTGKHIHLDHEQKSLLLERYGADSIGLWVSKFSKLELIPYSVLRAFENGIQSSISHDFETVLSIAEEFYSMMDSRYF